MKRTRFGILALSALAFASFALVSAGASAEETQTIVHQKKSDGYGYIFADDLVDGVNNGAAGAQIRVINLGRRDRLLRPRVHFVPEMLKSVENL